MKTIFIFIFIFILSGCATKYTYKTNFIEFESDSKQATIDTKIIINSDFKEFYTKRMWYTINNELKDFGINFWAKNPIDLTKEAFLAQGFTTEKNEHTKYLAKINILKFHQEFQNDKSYAISSFQIFIYDAKTKKIIIYKNLHFKTFCEENSPKGSLQGFKKNLEDLISETKRLIIS